MAVQMIRSRVEFALAGAFVLLALVTALMPAWIEVVFRVDPDAGSGVLEWALVTVLALLAVIAAFRGMRDYRRAARTE
jgi:hypothetical protein